MQLKISRCHQPIPGLWPCAFTGLGLAFATVMYVMIYSARNPADNFFYENIWVFIGIIMLRTVDMLFYTGVHTILRTITGNEPDTMEMTYGSQLSWIALTSATSLIIGIVCIVITRNGHAPTDDQLQIIILATAGVPTGLILALVAVYFLGGFLELYGRTVQKMIRRLYA